MTDIAVVPEQEYRRRIWAWTMYDWANSAFATTILAAVLPVYFSKVAGATLPSAARATAYWSAGLSISLLIVAILSPILGTVSDISRSKKRFLAIFAGLGVISTALLVLVSTGDWVLASILAILGRVGFNGSLTFYDALLPHVARPEDQDRVSARGFAVGYLGGGLLLAINVLMIQFIPGTWGARLSFLSVAIWWAVFTLPLLLQVPEPHTATASLEPGENVLTVSFGRLVDTLRGIRRYRELFKYLLAFLIYNDGIGTIIGVAVIYGAEMGLGSTELILALLLVQFAGIPYSLIFGRLPSAGDKRRPMYLAFILFNLIALPLAGLSGARLLPTNISGMPPAIFETSGNFQGEGIYTAESLQLNGNWTHQTISANTLGSDQDAVYLTSATPGDAIIFTFYGQQVEITFAQGPDYGFWAVEMDGAPLLDEDGVPVVIDGENLAVRYGEIFTLDALNPGEHTLKLSNTGGGAGDQAAITSLKVLPGVRASNLGVVLGIILALEAVGLLFAFLVAPLFRSMAEKFDTKRSILLSLLVYAAIAVWGFFINSVVEFWLLAWMVSIVQGGSQALSRSLYAALSPASKSGEFFGLFAVMEKFASLIGPAMFAAAALIFSSSRPAVLSLIVLFIVGGLILARVDVAKGKEAAQE
jgi:UMF1 family MFS transporter